MISLEKGKSMTGNEIRAYRDQIKVMELTFKNEVDSIIEKVHKLSVKYPKKIFSVNDIQNLE